MPRLKVKERAESLGLNMSQLQVQSGLSMGAIRRYWYNSSDGKEGGKPLKVVYLEQLAAVAHVLGVSSGDLIEDKETGNSLPQRLAA